MEYRKDIDGLRAISVVLVLLFHLGVPHVSGGFVGVDVFFVISGYLITGVILGAMERGQFSFAGFYDRRARRILPALLAVTLFTAVGGYFLLYPGDYEVFAWSAIAALLAYSNVFFLNNTGYFDIPSQTMPLLHTWSLGVEEQFYFLWPALLAIGFKFFGASKATWGILFGIVVAVGFLASAIQVAMDTKYAFYLPYARAWELALGALLFVTPAFPERLKWLRELLPAVGLTAIGYAAVTLHATAPFPGFNALAPVIGAALIIYSSGPTALTQRLLGAAPLRFVGLISYSLYLWHWPLIVFWRVYNNGLPPSPVAMLAISIISVALSVLSWWLIERPAKRVRASSVAVLGTALLADIAAIVLISAIVLTAGVPNRVPADMQAISSKEKMWTWRCPQSAPTGLLAGGLMLEAPTCAFGADWKTARQRALVWGDSISEMIAPELHEAGRNTDTAVTLAPACAAITQPAAPRHIGADGVAVQNPWCDAARTRVLAYIAAEKNIDFVVLLTSWSLVWPMLKLDSQEEARVILRDGLDRLLTQIEQVGKRPIVIGDLPASLGPDPTSCLLAVHALSRRPCTVDPAYIDIGTIKSYVDTHAMLKETVQGHAGAAWIDPMDFLCDQTRCSKYFAGEFLYRDAVHLRRNLRPETVKALSEAMKLEAAFSGKLPAPR